MSQLHLEKRLGFSAMKIFIALFKFLLDVLLSAYHSVIALSKDLARMIVKKVKLSSDNFSRLAINLSNKEPSTIYSVEGFFISRLLKTSFYEVRKINKAPLQLFGSCDRISNQLFLSKDRFVDFPIFKTKMII